MYCPKGCLRRVRPMPHGVLAVESVRIYSARHSNTASRVATPPGIITAYAEMVSLLENLGSPPALEFYDDLRGVGGLFLADAWAIAIGVQDIEDIADGVLGVRRPEVARIVNELSPGMGRSARIVRQLMIAAGMGRCVGHELGHAIIFRGWANPFAPDGEAGADYYAGRFDAARRADWRLGEMFFRAIGCVGPSCEHPTPDGRSSAYLTGYRDQLLQAA